MQYVIGIDPGLTGAMCLYNMTTDKVEEVLNSPVYKKDKRTHLHGLNILNKLKEWSLKTTNVVIEKQTIIRGKDGTKSSMTTMTNYGYLLGLLASLDLKVEVIDPVTWQASMLKDVIDPGEPVKTKPTKRKSLVLTRLFNPKNDGQADAIALCLYWSKVNKSND